MAGRYNGALESYRGYIKTPINLGYTLTHISNDTCSLIMAVKDVYLKNLNVSINRWDPKNQTWRDIILASINPVHVETDVTTGHTKAIKIVTKDAGIIATILFTCTGHIYLKPEISGVYTVSLYSKTMDIIKINYAAPVYTLWTLPLRDGDDVVRKFYLDTPEVNDHRIVLDAADSLRLVSASKQKKRSREDVDDPDQPRVKRSRKTVI